MGLRRFALLQTARFLVRIRHDRFVSYYCNLISMNNTANLMLFIFNPSVMLPWFTVREVKVDIEIVRLL